MKRGRWWTAGLLGLVLGTGAAAAAAESPKIEAIRRLYQAAIAQDDGDEDNTRDLSLSGSRVMPGTGEQRVNLSFHEVRVPADPEQPGPFVLRLVTVEYNIAAHPLRQEFLFDDAGQLVFHFKREVCAEHRSYFDGGKLLRVARQRDEQMEHCQQEVPGPARVQKDGGFSAAEQQQARKVEEHSQTLRKLFKEALW